MPEMCGNVNDDCGCRERLVKVCSRKGEYIGLRLKMSLDDPEPTDPFVYVVVGKEIRPAVRRNGFYELQKLENFSLYENKRL